MVWCHGGAKLAPCTEMAAAPASGAYGGAAGDGLRRLRVEVGERHGGAAGPHRRDPQGGTEPAAAAGETLSCETEIWAAWTPTSPKKHRVPCQIVAAHDDARAAGGRAEHGATAETLAGRSASKM